MLLRKTVKSPGTGLIPQGVSYSVVPWCFNYEENPFAIKWDSDMIESNRGSEKVIYLEQENNDILEKTRG